MLSCLQRASSRYRDLLVVFGCQRRWNSTSGGEYWGKPGNYTGPAQRQRNRTSPYLSDEERAKGRPDPPPTWGVNIRPPGKGNPWANEGDRSIFDYSDAPEGSPQAAWHQKRMQNRASVEKRTQELLKEKKSPNSYKNASAQHSKSQLHEGNQDKDDWMWNIFSPTQNVMETVGFCVMLVFCALVWKYLTNRDIRQHFRPGEGDYTGPLSAPQSEEVPNTPSG